MNSTTENFLYNKDHNRNDEMYQCRLSIKLLTSAANNTKKCPSNGQPYLVFGNVFKAQEQMVLEMTMISRIIYVVKKLNWDFQ